MTAKRHIVVVYHALCVDGVASAWIANEKLKNEPDTAVSFVSYSHSDPAAGKKKILAALKADSELYFLDVAPQKQFLDELLSPSASGRAKAASVHIIDHHKTVAEALAGYKPPAVAGFTPPTLGIFIDEAQPAAADMVWEYFFHGKKKCAFLDVVSKMDIGAGLVTRDDFAAAALVEARNPVSIEEAFDACDELSKMTFAEMAKEGSNILNDQKSRVERLNDDVTFALMELLPGQPAVWVPVVNVNVQDFGRSITNFLLEIGEAAGSGVAIAWHENGNGTVSASLRSDGDPDLSAVAEHLCKTLGVIGGGHGKSAAVHFPSLKDFCDKIIRVPEAEMNKILKSQSPPARVFNPQGKRFGRPSYAP